MSIDLIIRECGLPVSRYQRVYGGDINTCYCLFSNEKKYFLKTNRADSYPGMFNKEAAGLEELESGRQIRIPAVLSYGVVEFNQYLLLEWLEKGPPEKNCMEEFGRNLASLHKTSQPYFGFKEDNFIGSLPQINARKDNWDLFFAECRILPLVKILYDDKIVSGKDMYDTEEFCKKVNQLFPKEHPSLVHGDLWSGNYLIADDGYACIFDPAVYYGHREMDIGMTWLFGGFGEEFYRGYNESYPLQPGWKDRITLTQLYPLLVHAILFGGHYISQAISIIRGYQ